MVLTVLIAEIRLGPISCTTSIITGSNCSTIGKSSAPSVAFNSFICACACLDLVAKLSCSAFK